MCAGPIFKNERFFVKYLRIDFNFFCLKNDSYKIIIDHLVNGYCSLWGH